MTLRPGLDPVRVAAAVFVLASLLVLATAGVATGQDGASIQVDDVELATGETGTVNVSIHGLEDGLAGYWMMVASTDADVVTITNVTHTEALESTANPQYAADNSSVNVSAPDRYRNVQPGDADVELFTLTVEAGDTPGEATLGVPRHQIDSDGGDRLDMAVEAGQVTVTPRPTVEIPDAELTPGETTTLNVSIDTLQNGLAGYRMTLGVSNANAVTITDASYPDALASAGEPEIGGDGATVTVAADDVDGAVEPGDQEAALVQLTVEAANEEGAASIGVRDHAFEDDDGGEMAIAVNSGQLDVRTPNPLDDENALRIVLMISLGGVALLVAGFVRLVGIG